MNIFPIVKNGSFKEGKVFNIASGCKMGKEKKCHDFCISPQFLTITECPFGYTVYKINENTVVFGIKIKGYYKKKKESNLEVFSPSLDIAMFNKLVKESDMNSFSPNINSETNFTNSILHEVRKLNTAIKSASEKIILMTKDSDDHSSILNKAKNVFASSSLISMRLNTYDFEMNPEKIAGDKKTSVGIYKKFEKATHILEEEAHKKKCNIKLAGESRLTIEALPIFELLPFVLIENAVKYSYEKSEIEIIFQEDKTILQIEIKNKGPSIEKGTVNDLFKKKYRGAHAKKIDKTGYGYGLYLAKIICDLHAINISIDCQEYDFLFLNNVPYSQFTLILKFDV